MSNNRIAYDYTNTKKRKNVVGKQGGKKELMIKSFASGKGSISSISLPRKEKEKKEESVIGKHYTSKFRKGKLEDGEGSGVQRCQSSG